MIILFGSTGLIGQCLVAQLQRDSFFTTKSRICIPWLVIQTEGIAAILDQLKTHLHNYTQSEFVHIVFANGNTDPNAPPADLLFSNYEFPMAIMAGTLSDSRIRYLSLGTIQEHFLELSMANPYLKTKLKLGRAMQAMANQYGHHRFCHCRLHTVYGHPIKPHMFLGQMVTAIQQHTEFRMSSGQQLREYHDAEDIGRALGSILKSEWTQTVLEINSGQPIRLCDLATFVFQKFGRLHQLIIGEVVPATGENTDRIFPRSPDWILPESRDPFSGVLAVVKACVADLDH